MKIIRNTVQNYKLILSIKDNLDEKTSSFIKTYLNRQIEQFSKVTDRYNVESELFKFNNSIDIFHGSKEFFDYLSDATYWLGITDGIFNPFASQILEDLKIYRDKSKWKDEGLFKLDKIDLDFPKKLNQLSEYLEIDYTNQTVKFFRPVELDFSGLKKGKFVDKLCKQLSNYIKHYSMSFGGDAYFKTPKEKKPWEYSITNPVTKEEKILTLQLSNEAFSMSGQGVYGLRDGIKDYEKFSLLDPNIQKKADSNLASVTVQADNCITSDTLAKTFYIGSILERKKLEKKFKNIKRIEIDRKGKVVLY